MTPSRIARTLPAVLILAALAACTNPAPPVDTPEPTGRIDVPSGSATAPATIPVPAADTPDPTPAVTNTPYPGSVDEPFPLGEEAGWTSAEGVEIEIEITEAYRGFAARQAVLAHGEPAPAAPNGFEWFYFRASVQYTGPDRGPVELDAGFWRAVSAGTTTTWEDAPLCCLEPGFDFTLIQGETRAGVLVLLVSVADPEPLIGAGREAAIHFAASPDTLTQTKVLFEDDFSSETGGWQDIYRDETGISDYDAGGFRIQVQEPNFDYWANPGLDFADVRIEVEAARIGGPEDNAFGLICRYVDAENFYFFLIASDGYYAIGKYTGGEFHLIGSDLMVPTNAVLGEEAVNRLGAECMGETLRLFVNGEQLAEVTDTDHANGDVGLIAGTFDEPGTDILFDHFGVLGP